jgi:adenosine deaminase
VLTLLAEHAVCCDLALTSNLLLTSFRDLASHPIRQMLEAGVPVTLSTDDPAFFNTDLVREYSLAHREVGLSLAELWEINLNGLRFGLADVAVRRSLIASRRASRCTGRTRTCCSTVGRRHSWRSSACTWIRRRLTR